MFFDAHAHVSRLPLDCAEEYLAQINLMGLIDCGYDKKSWVRSNTLQSRFEKCFSAFGQHPWVEEKLDIDTLLTMLKNSGCAVGEIGLDYSHDNHEQQRELFETQLDIAQNLNLPVVLHIHRADRDALASIDRILGYRNQSGMLHGFKGSFELAGEYIKRGFLISMGPKILKSPSKRLLNTIEKISFSSLLIESDIDSRDKSFDTLEKTAAAIARIRHIPTEKVEEETSLNAKMLFRI